MTTMTEKIRNYMTNARFGIEIECKRLGNRDAANVIATLLGSTAVSTGGYYGKYLVNMADGTDRDWICMDDGSLSGVSTEVVSPILTMADMPVLQDIVRALRRGGAMVDDQCGIHVHVDGSPLTAEDLGRLTALVYQREDLLHKALRFGLHRERWAAKTPEDKAKRLRRAKTKDAAKRAWYGRRNRYDRDPAREHYHSSRYAGLNLHSFFYRGTVEFRWFAATLHAGKVRAYVTLCMALVARARASRVAVVRKAALIDNDEKWTMYCWLYNSLGLRGADNKAVRKHLTDHLPGYLRGGGARGPARTAA